MKNMETSTKELKNFFTQKLMEWNVSENDRELPWKHIENPYFIWLSEIILQQTRAEQALPYYLKFTENYPTVEDLANAPEDEVMKMWEGLGYYSRARNLHFAAKYIVLEKGGQFPNTHKEILKLKGVGPYTAAAIASFAFKLPYAVVDGNVYRVLSRFFGIETPIDSTEGKKQFAKLAQELIDTEKPDQYNQAIMDFGARQCSPAKPLCMFCPMNVHCEAYLKGKTGEWPIKSKKIKKRERFFHYLLVGDGIGFFIKKRTEKGIWRNLYDFPLIETNKELDDEALKELIEKKLKKDEIGKVLVSKNYVHLLTHQKINVKFVEIKNKDQQLSNKALQYVMPEDLKNYAFPKVILRFFEEKGIIC